MPERECGCAWQVVSAAEAPTRIRHHVGGAAVKFVRRCPDHEPMCRNLEDWEIDIAGPVEPAGGNVAETGPQPALISPVSDQRPGSQGRDTNPSPAI